MNDLQGKEALVCGGSKGIGFASAYLLAEMGANVTLLSRDQTTLEASVKKLPKISDMQSHNYISVDTNQLEDLKSKVLGMNKEFVILINNSGGPPAGSISQAKNDEFEAAFRQHLLVNHTLSMLLIENMKKHSFGRIINIISTSVKQPLPNLGVSNTIRAAVANWSKTLATELAPFGITVNNILPGATATGRLSAIIENKATKTNVSLDTVEDKMKEEIPMKRFARPEEIAAAVGFLASTTASYITGINIPVDGGRTGCL